MTRTLGVAYSGSLSDLGARKAKKIALKTHLGDGVICIAAEWPNTEVLQPHWGGEDDVTALWGMAEDPFDPDQPWHLDFPEPDHLISHGAALGPSTSFGTGNTCS